jgi:transcription termination factor Rho
MGGQRRPFGNGENNYVPNYNVPTETLKGILDIMPEGHGFLRPKFTPSDHDVYISQSQIRRFLLRNGDMVEGQARPPKENERYWGLLKVEKVNELPAEEMVSRPKFEDLTPVYPNKILHLETGQLPLSSRIIDLVAPIGFGQRGLIVSPPKAGKTTILKEIAAGVTANYPKVHLMAALIGERPEEVTDITRSVQGEVLASNFDESPAEQTRIAEVALDRAKRLVEMGRDVVILLDSITRLARAYNLVVNPSGRTLSGGFDPAALYPAKRFLGAARCVEQAQSTNDDQSNPKAENIQKKDGGSESIKHEDGQTAAVGTVKSVTGGGSLTVIGTALIDTGSRMDDLIYEEFKGTGNMELTLSRSLQERRIFPAIDVARSGTRHDELLIGEETMKKVTTLRHMLSLLNEEERTVMLVERLSKTKTNDEFLESLAKG